MIGIPCPLCKNHGYFSRSSPTRCSHCLKYVTIPQERTMIRSDDDTPITAEWLMLIGYQPIRSPMGEGYDDHYMFERLRLWEFNGTGDWLIEEMDHFGVRTRRQLRMLMQSLSIKCPLDDVKTKPRPERDKYSIQHDAAIKELRLLKKIAVEEFDDDLLNKLLNVEGSLLMINIARYKAWYGVDLLVEAFEKEGTP